MSRVMSRESVVKVRQSVHPVHSTSSFPNKMKITSKIITFLVIKLTKSLFINTDDGSIGIDGMGLMMVAGTDDITTHDRKSYCFCKL